MGSKLWKFPQALAVNSGSSSYSCMTWILPLFESWVGGRIFMFLQRAKEVIGCLHLSASGAGTARGASVYLIWAGQGGSPNHRWEN